MPERLPDPIVLRFPIGRSEYEAMPTYEYECTKCGHLFEVFQSMTAEPIKKCPECACRVKRLFGTGAGLLFKGGGFYETDYRSESYKKAAEKDKKASEDKSTKKGSDDKKKGAGSDKKKTTSKKTGGGSDTKKKSA